MSQTRTIVAAVLTGGAVLTLSLVGVVASCETVPETVTCALDAATTPPSPVAAAAAAEVFWDNSGSMKAFYTKKGPYARIGDGMEALILPAAGIFKFEHVYVAEGVERAERFHEPSFSGNYSDLLSAAQEMALAVQDPAKGVAILVSDLLIVTTPEQRASAEDVCGTTLPGQNAEAPLHFAKCFEFALKKGSPESLFASVVRVPTPSKAMYVLVAAHSPAAGRAVVEQVLAATAAWTPTELRLVDTTGAEGLVEGASCASTTADPVYMVGRSPGTVPRCDFRFREAASHHLACSTVPHTAGGGLVGMRPESVESGGSRAPMAESGGFALEVLKQSGSAPFVVHSAFVSPEKTVLAATVRQFVTGGGDPAVPLSHEQEHVAAVIEGLIPALAGQTPPNHAGWTVAYQ